MASPSPCFNFTQVNQTGGSLLPAEDPGWALEISLDIEWAHALAPAASILLVEANDNNVSSLGVAKFSLRLFLVQLRIAHRLDPNTLRVGTLATKAWAVPPNSWARCTRYP